MRTAIGLVGMLLFAACAPRTLTPHPMPPSSYTVTPDPAPAPPPGPSSAAARDVMVWQSENERSFYLSYYVVLEGYRCLDLSRDEALRLAVALRRDNARFKLSDSRQAVLTEHATAQVRGYAAKPLSCDGKHLPLLRIVQAEYRRPPTPRPAPPALPDGRTGPADTGWQPGPSAPRPLPPPRPDQIDL